jgi:hypothetical protein
LAAETGGETGGINSGFRSRIVSNLDLKSSDFMARSVSDNNPVFVNGR